MFDDTDHGDPRPHGFVRGCVNGLLLVIPFWLLLGILIWRLWPYA